MPIPSLPTRLTFTCRRNLHRLPRSCARATRITRVKIPMVPSRINIRQSADFHSHDFNRRLPAAAPAGHDSPVMIRQDGATYVKTERLKEKRKRKPGKRDTVIFAAIVLELKGVKYCSFLRREASRPKGSDPGPATYT